MSFLSLIKSVKSASPRSARLSADEHRLANWYEALEWPAQDAWYTLHELSMATGIPMTRLRTALWRNGWTCEYRRGYQLVVWHGPHGSARP